MHMISSHLILLISIVTSPHEHCSDSQPITMYHTGKICKHYFGGQAWGGEGTHLSLGRQENTNKKVHAVAEAEDFQ